ncbi:MAG: phosphotransferase [Chloroflexota bacterium]
MKTEPDITKSALIAFLRDEFGIPVNRLDFWPSFWTSACYIVYASDGMRYFLKLTPENYTLTIASDPEFYLPLTYELYKQNILPRIAYPFPARDQRFIRLFEGFRAILFNYIEGETVGFGMWPEGLVTRLAGLVGKLHRSIRQISPSCTLGHVMEEYFHLIFECDLRRNLNQLERVTATERPGIRKLAALLLPRKDTLLGLLARTHELQTYAIAAKKPKVFCHTDLHGGNLMLDPSSDVYIIDWEGAILAPPEQDLFFFAWKDDFWQNFLPAYETEFGPAQLDSKIFGFYFYRRNLEDLADWVNRILHHNTTAEQDAEDLYGIERDCLSGWPYLEENIRQIETRLRERLTHP